jgi:DNA protecting protein DprA
MAQFGMSPIDQTKRPIKRARYHAPSQVERSSLVSLLQVSGRAALEDKQLDLLRSSQEDGDIPIFYAGDLTLLTQPCVSIVGTREVSENGWKRARRLARELVRENAVVVSGLAKGVDTAALTSAIESEGRTIAVIGTPIDKAYPAENALLQEEIYSDHLLISQFRPGETVFKANFPKRNRVMAALSDATVIIEASDTSGTLHQAAECQRLGRWLFIAQSVAEDPNLKWPSKFLGQPKVAILTSTDDILARISI